jgi:hypothetical protein
MQPIGSMGKIQLLRSSDKVFEVAKFHYWLRSVRPAFGSALHPDSLNQPSNRKILLSTILSP